LDLRKDDTLLMADVRFEQGAKLNHDPNHLPWSASGRPFRESLFWILASLRLAGRWWDEGSWVALVGHVLGELFDETADLGVLPEHRPNRLIPLDIAELCIAGHELVFLVAEMRFSAALPEGEEPPDYLSRRGFCASGGIAEFMGLHKPVAVLAGKRLKTWMADETHRANQSNARREFWLVACDRSARRKA